MPVVQDNRDFIFTTVLLYTAPPHTLLINNNGSYSTAAGRVHFDFFLQPRFLRLLVEDLVTHQVLSYSILV